MSYYLAWKIVSKHSDVAALSKHRDSEVLLTSDYDQGKTMAILSVNGQYMKDASP